MIQRIVPAAAAALVLSSCATTPPAPDARSRDPRYLLDQACSPGRTVTAAKGSIFMKAKSTEAEGQFPADVEAKAPARLRLEVQNPFGGTEAVISIEDQKYSIQVPKKKEQDQEGYGSWAGIPLRWATDLFLGRIPCPPSAEIRQTRVTDKGELEIETTGSLQGAPEKFVFAFRRESDESWPETLRWERTGTFAVTVDFKFQDPETRTRSPLKWEAKSARGEVKVRWRDRRTSR